MKKSTSQQSKRGKRNLFLWVGVAIFASVLLALTHDIIITNILAYRICKADPQPKTFINQTVEYPESIYWEDNIYPGFDEKDRLLMIRHYLDGVHLKTMALNAPDGTIHVYTATEEDWRKSREIKARKREGDYFKTIETESEKIAERGATFTRQTMPKLDYSVTFAPVSLTPFQRRYLWSDVVTITDNRTDEVIAYNCRLMRRWYMILPDVGRGNQYYYPKPMCGWPGYAGFDHFVFVFYENVFVHPAHMGINSDLFKKMKNSRGGK